MLIIVLKSKPFRVWAKGRNKSEAQKKAIKFLIYGPEKSKITTEEYEELCYGMYPDDLLYEKAKAKHGINDSDIVMHSHEKINSRYLVVRNYLKNDTDGSNILSCQLKNGDFRSAQMLAFMVLFGREKLYFYQLYYHTDMTREEESSYEYDYNRITSFNVSGTKDKDSVYAEFIMNWLKDDEKEYVKKFPSMVMGEESYKRWLTVSSHLDTPALREEYAKKSDAEKKAFRYFRAHCNLPLTISDDEYENMVSDVLPANQLKVAGMDNMDIRDSDIKLATPISFYSYVYGDNYAVEGKDHSWRSNIPQHTWLFFGKRQIYVYSTSMRMDTSLRQESTQEIFYNDISSVRTEQFSKEMELDGVHYIMTYYQFTILFAGDKLILTLPIMSDQNDQKIRAMRNLLRETKHQQPSTVATEVQPVGDDIV